MHYVKWHYNKVVVIEVMNRNHGKALEKQQTSVP